MILLCYYVAHPNLPDEYAQTQTWIWTRNFNLMQCHWDSWCCQPDCACQGCCASASHSSAAQCRYLLARQPAAPLAHCLPTFQTFTLISCSVQVSLARQPAAPAPRPPCPLFAHFSNSFATFQTFCPDGVHFAQTAVQFAHFQNQARKGVFWSEVGGVLCTYISPTRVCDGWVKNRGCWWYSVQNETPSGQNETHLGNLYEK